MKILLLSISVFVLTIPFRGKSQNQSLYIPRNVQYAFGNGTRSMTGNPGPHYWQNRADYVIDISFDPKSLLLKGSETITYFNNSPDTLKQVVIHLYPDLYKKGLMRNYPIDEADENNGVTVEELKIGNQVINTEEHAGYAVLTGTNLFVRTPIPITPKSTTSFTISWHYTVNKGSHVRTGEVDSSSFFLAYTFPRIAVYDDIDGWDDWSYSGLQEFYNDFGNFDVTIRVPRGFVVWATGELQNSDEVFDKRIQKKYRTALSSDNIIHIIDSSDYISGRITGKNEINSWKFIAKDVTDFAFATSDHFLWDGSSLIVEPSTKRRVFVDAAYNRNSKDFYEVADVARKCVDIMSTKYPGIPFPFPHQTIFNGLDQMEYPMMVNDNSTDTRKDMVQLTSHEIMHAYFPFYMGINETKYAWMDEGWATIGESVISPMLGEPEDDDIYMRRGYELIAGTDNEAPMITNSEIITAATYFTNSYGKPGLFYWVLQNTLGDTLFFKAIHEYANRWHGRHPTPYDFFNTLNNATGQDLNWLIRPWFFEQGYPDLALKEVKQNNGKYEIVIERVGSIPVPIYLEFMLEDNSLASASLSASVWKDGQKEYHLTQDLSAKPKVIRLGNGYIPDVNRQNNVWKAK